ncbi:uncharacterized protein LOC129577939 [Sitodiplosis mosellana]|uniref:uncharacterized protein LOC129577939 n=1 Tax=Sitodiplosis mosellana TaxID=263140 RepID=UPI00244424E3|nr:uncharacterized protein LOC129577939 [Sitodiplosis mosellana]
MICKVKHVTFVILNLCVIYANSHTAQKTNNKVDDSNPFLDIATSFLQETFANQQGGRGGGNGIGGTGIAGIAQLIGSLVQQDGSKSNGGGIGAAQILTGLSQLMNANGGDNGGGGSGFDPSIIGNVIEMFTAAGDNSDDDDDQPQAKRRKRSNSGQDGGIGIDTILNIASAFMGNTNNVDSHADKSNEGLMSLLPMAIQAINSFNGPAGEKVHAKHKDHQWVLPPFLERIHVLWDHFSNSELAEALWEKSGVNQIFKGFTGRDGKLDYDKLFNSLHNQAFRRRWLKATTLYLSDWVNYIAEPEVYKRYFTTAQLMINGFLTAQGIPPHALFDPHRPSESLANLFDFIAREHLHTKISTIVYVKPAVTYVRDLVKLGKARGLLQKFNATELSDKLTDTVNLEVIEPVLKVHRAYRFASRSPQCDKYVLCEVNSHDPNETLGLAGFKAGITKFSSMAAAWFIGSETGTPFWTLFSVISDPYDCKRRYPVDCSGFHEGEAKVTTEYIHNEL